MLHSFLLACSKKKQEKKTNKQKQKHRSINVFVAMVTGFLKILHNNIYCFWHKKREIHFFFFFFRISIFKQNLGIRIAHLQIQNIYLSSGDACNSTM